MNIEKDYNMIVDKSKAATMAVCTTNWNIARIYLEGMLTIKEDKDDAMKIQAMLRVITVLADAKDKLKAAMEEGDLDEIVSNMIKRN